ncbi:PREDICTED: toll-like receptor 6 [Acropora digitifera]|uniref:toll-like receptor 6 n=1 Tax=Acropora digitifera TaxID=70779 RepID=UPI00077AB1B1|nr:PREDICTED: toll-like receptor 6 [Acropora digitifera]
MKRGIIKENEHEQPAGFKFDAFIIYSTKDGDWVKKKLLATLEKKHNIKCCIYYRDFLPGLSLRENMVQSIYNSRKTIAVVSKRFLRSKYCNQELSIAVHRLVEREDDSVIVIKLDDVEDSKLPIDLQSRSYIDFTKANEKKAWEYKLVQMFEENPAAPHQAVAANNLGNQASSAIPERGQQHPFDAVVTSGNKKERQGARHGASGDQQDSLRKYGGMRN